MKPIWPGRGTKPTKCRPGAASCPPTSRGAPRSSGPQHDLGRRPPGSAYARRPTADQVVRDLHARASRPDDAAVLIAKRLGVAVLRGMEEAAGKALAPRPVGDLRCVLEARGD